MRHLAFLSRACHSNRSIYRRHRACAIARLESQLGPAGAHYFHPEHCLAVSTRVLYYTSRYVGCCYDVYSFSFLPTGGAPITGHSGSFRSFATATVCWLVGACFSASSVSFVNQPGSQHANADGLSRQCGQCLRPDCPVAPPDVGIVETTSASELANQPFAESAMRLHGLGFAPRTFKRNVDGRDSS